MKMRIARDRWGNLELFRFRPYEYNGSWYESNDVESDSLPLFPTNYPEVTFENSPKEVELKLIER